MNSASSDALRPIWHPVGYGEALGATPLQVTLLGERIVVWRDRDGVARALLDQCIHRGTALSLGTIEDGALVCPYHGWHFAADGRCTRIPQLPEPTRVPSRAVVPAYQCVERYGLLWVALDTPRWPLPEVPELEAPGWFVVRTGPFPWQAHASRQLENFTDFGHFAFVHEGLLGNRSQPVVAPYDTTIDGHRVHYTYGRPDEPNTDAMPVFAAAERKDSRRRTRYTIHLPYTIVEHIDWAGPDGMVYFFVSQPVDANHCIGYCIVARNFNFDQAPAVMQEFERTIFGQDQRIVESQIPRAIAFGEDAELHLAFDKAAIAYRRAMREQGLG